jgi:hypothetical protein
VKFTIVLFMERGEDAVSGEAATGNGAIVEEIDIAIDGLDFDCRGGDREAHDPTFEGALGDVLVEEGDAAVVALVALDTLVEVGNGAGVALENLNEDAVVVDQDAGDVMSGVEVASLAEELEEFLIGKEKAGGTDVDQLAEGRRRLGRHRRRIGLGQEIYSNF